MATKPRKSIEQMLAEADAKIRSDLTEISNLARKDFRNKAQDALVTYYANYPKPPRIYERTENLLQNAINDDMSFDDFVISDADSYGAWVHLNADNMEDYETGDKYAVLSNFMYGIHGKPSIKVDINPAIVLMDSFQTNYKKTLDKYFTERGFIVN